MKSEKIYFDGIPDNFVNVVAGEAIRLFPFGKFYKGGKLVNFTKELAKKFKLPHFKPPIKLGSHEDNEKGGGVIVGLEVREDGLYGLPEFTEKGATSFDEGDYKYHSPEVIWEGGIEDSETGDVIEGPLIIGMALLHTPHLGESAALYSIGEDPEQKTEVQKMTVETVEVPKKWYDGLGDFFKKEEPAPEVEPEVKPDEFTSLQSERDEYKLEIETMKAEKEQAELFSAVRSEFESDEFGAAFQGIGKEDEAIELLASFDEAEREWVLTQFKALSAQIDESKLTKEIGSEDIGEHDNPIEAFDSAVAEYAKEKEVDYAAALMAVSKTQPELLKAYNSASRK